VVTFNGTSLGQRNELFVPGLNRQHPQHFLGISMKTFSSTLPDPHSIPRWNIHYTPTFPRERELMSQTIAPKSHQINGKIIS
jgi:hypothetical protein